MIKLVGEKLQQYDLNRQVEIIPTENSTVLEVKFLNRSPNPFEVAFTEENGRVYAGIPNILLKTFGVITVETLEMLEDGSQIEQRMTFNVDKRKKPEGYECPADAILTKNYLKNNSSGELPFGERTTYGDTLTWDGNTEGRNTFNNFYFVSNAVPTIEDFSKGGTLTVFSAGHLDTVEIGGSLVVWTNVSEQFGTEAYALVAVTDENMMLVGVLPNGAELDGVVYEKGVYFQKPDNITYITSLTIPGFNGFETTETVPLPYKYLPKGEEVILKDTIVWDGDMTGKTIIELGGQYLVHVSDLTPSLEDVQNGVEFIDNANSWSVTRSEDFGNMGNVLSLIDAIIVYSDNYVLEGMVTFPKAGVYFFYTENRYTTQMKIKNYQKFNTKVLTPDYLIIYVRTEIDGSCVLSATTEEIIDAIKKGKNIMIATESQLLSALCGYAPRVNTSGVVSLVTMHSTTSATVSVYHYRIDVGSGNVYKTLFTIK